MKRDKILNVLAMLALVGTMLTGCAQDDSLTYIDDTDKSGESAGTVDVVAAALGAIPQVKNLNIKVDAQTKDSVYFFTFAQYIDHHHPELGTFEQRVALHFEGFDRNVVLYTHGYNMASEVNEMRKTDLAIHLKANTIEVEHRYFGESLPEPYDELKFTYFNAEQEAFDLHEIVQALRKNVFKKGKWASTGTSKDGMTTAFYAYFSDKNGWNDIDVYVPFCAPFMTGSTDAQGNFSEEDYSTGYYLEDVCGSGYPAGSIGAIAYERLRNYPYYICTSPMLRQFCIRNMLMAYPDDGAKILAQYEKGDVHSTGDKEKDLTAWVINTFYGNLFEKFSYVPYTLWASMVPDPAKAAAADASAEDLMAVTDFLMLSRDSLIVRLRAMNETRVATPDEDPSVAYWMLLQYLREDSASAYYLQAFLELCTNAYPFSLVDGVYLTPEQVRDVNHLFAWGSLKGLYPQDEGKMQKDFRRWVYTETTAPIIFVYGKNDPWTGAAIDDAAAEQNPLIVKVVDPVSTHNDYFLSDFYDASSRRTIIDALASFLKE